jgi:nucleoid-associated protein YgaU
MFDSTLDSEQAFGQHRTVSRTRVRRRRILAVMSIVVVAALGAPAAASAFGGPEVSGDRRVVVRPGDTLWDIAMRFEPGSDPREVVARIVEANHLDGAQIAPGQPLTLPSAG